MSLDSLATPTEAGDGPIGAMSPQEVRVHREEGEVEVEGKLHPLYATLHPPLASRGRPETENGLWEGHRDLHIPTQEVQGGVAGS